MLRVLVDVLLPVQEGLGFFAHVGFDSVSQRGVDGLVNRRHHRSFVVGVGLVAFPWC